MIRIRTILRASVIAMALAILPIAGAAFAHGQSTGEPAEFYEHMDVYAANISDMTARVESIVSNYQPGQKYAEQIEALIEQWESVEFHEAVEDNAMPLYPPVWAALGAFSSAISEGVPVATVEAKANDIKAALWQGYGALKLLAVQREQGHASGHEGKSMQLSGEAVIDTISDNLEHVLALYKDDQKKAAQELIHDTYMNYFEGIEGDLIEQNAELVSNLEADFNATLPALIKNGAPTEEVAAQINAMDKDLDKASELLEQAENKESSVF